MGRNTNYFIQKNKKTSEVILIDYDQKDGYQINTKAKKTDEINVNKIVNVSDFNNNELIKQKGKKQFKKIIIK